ncbi:hypothetical protein GCM10011613_21520 [Cellvibrio zantedeschiae]|uniref:DUF1631 domain-containing protein n=1 Tax=Cellvibrio zantedeschiae TaxID=1237077 RepID=A0ABQ3B731_9GAMM|nr:DUF1631 family protein [Cellvibrio zantedeschiae]GGY76721.1 hypothetical protein GCM10011613_21520 [Cellvibrio zantedeschiae]
MQPNFSIQNILQGNVAELEQLLRSAAAPSPVASLRTTTAEKLCSFVLKGDQFDLELSHQLIALQHALSPQIAQDDAFYCNPDHPLRSALQLILSRANIWYARDSKISQQFLEKLSEFIQVCVRGDLHNLRTAQQEFQRWLDSEDKRAAMLETRLCETEVNHFKMMSAEARVLDLINASLAFKLFPQDLSAGIANVLKSELLHSYFTAGSENPFWKKWQRLLPMLGKVFVTINLQERSEEDEQSLYRTIPALLNELETSLTLPTSNPDTYRQWVEGLSEQLMLAIKKQSIQCEAFVALSYPEGHNNLNTRVTSDLLQQTHNLVEGDWILFSGEHGQMIRCKLAMKSTEIDQLLFVDHTGRKVMNKSVKDFAVCLSTGIAKKLAPISIEETIAKILQALVDLFQHKQTQLQAQEQARQAKELADAELQRQAEEKRKQEIEAETKRQIVAKLAERQAAAQKALAEAAALAEERARRAAELKLEQERVRLQLEAEQAAEHLQRVQLANINISSLNLGARVELIINNEPVRCKLAVIIAASGKYIFVDNLGRKVAELQREHLVQAILDNQLSLLNNGDSFDDQLVKVIRGLRKDIS